MKDMKECFTPHVIMHVLSGVGAGIVLVNLIPALNILWLGIGLIVVTVAADMMRK